MVNSHLETKHTLRRKPKDEAILETQNQLKSQICCPKCRIPVVKEQLTAHLKRCDSAHEHDKWHPNGIHMSTLKLDSTTKVPYTIPARKPRGKQDKHSRQQTQHKIDMSRRAALNQLATSMKERGLSVKILPEGADMKAWENTKDDEQTPNVLMQLGSDSSNGTSFIDVTVIHYRGVSSPSEASPWRSLGLDLDSVIDIGTESTRLMGASVHMLGPSSIIQPDNEKSITGVAWALPMRAPIDASGTGDGDTLVVLEPVESGFKTLKSTVNPRFEHVATVNTNKWLEQGYSWHVDSQSTTTGIAHIAIPFKVSLVNPNDGKARASTVLETKITYRTRTTLPCYHSAAIVVDAAGTKNIETPPTVEITYAPVVRIPTRVHHV